MFGGSYASPDSLLCGLCGGGESAYEAISTENTAVFFGIVQRTPHSVAETQPPGSNSRPAGEIPTAVIMWATESYCCRFSSSQSIRANKPYKVSVHIHLFDTSRCGMNTWGGGWGTDHGVQHASLVAASVEPVDDEERRSVCGEVGLACPSISPVHREIASIWGAGIIARPININVAIACVCVKLR